MITRVHALLDKLYDDTATPKGYREYLTNPDIQSYIDRTFHRAGKKHPSYNLIDKEAEAVVSFLLGLMDTRINLEGVLLAEHPVIYMVEKGMARVRADAQDAQQFIAIVDAWYDILKDVPKKLKNFYNHEPNYETCPLLTFHTTAYKHSLLPDKTAPLYAAYAYKLHTDIRFNRQQDIDPETHLAYVRPARYFFEKVSPGIKQQKYHPQDRIPAHYVKDFSINMLKKGNIDRKTVGVHLRHFRELIKRKRIKPHPRISLRTSHNVKILASSAPPNVVSAGSSAPPSFLIHGFAIEPPPDIYAQLDFVEDIEFGYASFPDEPRLLSLSEKSTTFRHRMDYVHVRNYIIFWDAQYLNLFHLAILYHAIDKAREGSAQYRAIALYLYVLIHTGIDGEILLNTLPAQGYLPPDAIGIKVIDGRYYILSPSIIPPRTADPAYDCLPTATHVHIPIPKIIADLIPSDIMTKSHLFSFIQNNRDIHLTYYDVKHFLEDINKDFAAYDLNITIGHIENAFLPLYSSRYGLDPIIGCHISGDDRHKLYGSQLHYIHIPHALLADKYLATFSIVDSKIRQNLNECIGNKLIDGARRPLTSLNELPPVDNAGFRGYGSISTTSFEFVRKLISRLGDAVHGETYIIKRHNLFTCYLFLGIQFSTGYRPRSRQVIPWHLYNDRSGMLVIRDKDSAEFHEQRVLPLPAVIRSLLAKLRRGQSRLNDFVVRNLHITDQSEFFEQVLFFIDKNGRFMAFTPENMLDILRGASIDYPFPMNMPRHYLRNHLYHEGLSNDLADAWMGHQRDGRELLNITSSTIIGDALLKCLALVEGMATQIGFSDVEYIPS